MNQKRAIAGMLGMAIILASGGSRAQKSPLAQAAYRRAQEHLAASRFKEAAGEMETAVRYEPRFAMGWYVLASAERRAHRCDEAVFAYRRYMELRPAEPDPYYGAGLCLHTIGDLEAARTTLEHYVQSENRPTSKEFVAIARQHLVELERARAADGTKSGGAADATTSRASAADATTTVAGAGRAPTGSPGGPTAAAPLITEARQLREHGRGEEAVARYRAAMVAAPTAAEAPTELGALLVSMRRPAEAAEVLQAAVRLSTTSAPAWYNLAFALRESGHAAESVAAYRRYITFRPQDPDPHYGLARALAGLGRNQEALAAFRTYVALEKRPTEGRWVRKARLEITRIEATEAGSANPSAPGTSPPSVGAPRAPGAPTHGVTAKDPPPAAHNP